MTEARVLVVDDNPINIELATHVLEQEGFVVAGAGDAVEAMTCIERFPPDLILMDIQMPGNGRTPAFPAAQARAGPPGTWSSSRSRRTR